MRISNLFGVRFICILITLLFIVFYNIHLSYPETKTKAHSLITM